MFTLSRGMSMRKKFANLALILLVLVAISLSARAQSNPSSVPHWAIVVHQQALKVHDPSSSASVPPGIFPPVLGQTFNSLDPTGIIETYNLAAPTATKLNPFFQSLGTQWPRLRNLP